MGDFQTVLVLSDIHYAGPSEKQRGSTELKAIHNWGLRCLVKLYRHFIWRRDPFAHNHFLDRFLDCAQGTDYVVANGDYSCDTAFIGVSDDACFESVQLCLKKLRNQFGSKLRLTLGDHELGKMSLFGGRGGVRLGSLTRAEGELGLERFWTVSIGNYTLMGVASTLVALPVFEPEVVSEEHAQWNDLRAQHLSDIRESLLALKPDQRVLLFCHDPTALPYLWRDEVIRNRIPQIEATVIGHLHSQLFLLNSRLLSGMPTISFFGNSIRRMSSALQEAKLWRHFNAHLCPALGGIELLRDGGYLKVLLDPSGAKQLRFERHRMPPDRSPHIT